MKGIELKNIKTEKQLEQLSTKRLFAYYKAERHRKIRHIASCTCECCGEASWDLYPNEEAEKKHKKLIQDREDYLNLIKSVLDRREHIKDK